jgi:hypothetical protein
MKPRQNKIRNNIISKGFESIRKLIKSMTITEKESTMMKPRKRGGAFSQTNCLY